MVTFDQRLEKIRTYSSDPNAYAGLQSNLRYFDHPTGFLTYRKTLAGNVVLGAPVSSPENTVTLLSEFLAKHPASVFSYLTDDAATALLQASKKSLRFVQIGFERTIDLPVTSAYSPAVLGAIKKAKKAGLYIQEHCLSQLSTAEKCCLQQINDQFIKASPAGKEVGFISRPMQFSGEPDVRFFSINILSSPSPIGFFVLDPWYKNGKLERYQLHQFRLGPTKVWGVYLSVVALLIEKLQSEGILALSLGACVDIKTKGKPELPSSKVYQFCRDSTLRIADRYHPLKNLSRNKLEFAGTNINRYLAAPHKLPIVPLLRFAKANNMNLLPKW
jgi:lysylphosphatidylglycerol synthetase-like protein (DUF2156 family)